MHRRLFVTTMLAAAAAPLAALAQTQASTPTPAPRPFIEPQNELERAFVAAVDDADARPAFRRMLLRSQVAVPLASSAPDAEPFAIPLSDDARAALIFTSVARLDSVMGPAAPREILTGREAFERLRGYHVAINYQLMPMLTLEPDDVQQYLGTAATPAVDSPGPAQ